MNSRIKFRLKSIVIVACAVISAIGLGLGGFSGQAFADSNGSSAGQWHNDSCQWQFEAVYWNLSDRYYNTSFAPGKLCFTSGNNLYRMIFQTDGNLVIYSSRSGASRAIWATGTNRKGATRMTFQTDGNIVIYAGNRAIWNTGTYNRIRQTQAHFIMQSDGNLVLYGGPYASTGPVYWVSHTWHK